MHDVVEDVGRAEGIEEQQNRRRCQRAAQHDAPGRATVRLLRRA